METIFGDGSEQKKSLFGSLVGAGKRLVTGESLFTTVFVNQGSGKRKVSYAAPYPGKVLPMDLKELGGQLICQKDSFLCAAKGVSIGIAFRRKMGVGLFGGEGFIMQKLEGDLVLPLAPVVTLSMALLSSSSSAITRTLRSE